MTSGSLRSIATGVLLPAVLSWGGCYRPMMQPGYGYGSPMYGNQYGGYGGYQGIQTQTPGMYYAPGTTNPGTYAPGNNLQPNPDPNFSGSSGSGGGSNNGGNDAPVYSPPASNDTPSRPAPLYEDNPAGGDSNAPLQEPLTEQNSPGASLSKPAVIGDEGTIEQASGKTEGGGLDTETAETAESTEEEEPPLFAPPKQ